MNPFRRIPWEALATRLVLLGLALVFLVFFPASTPGGGSLTERVLGKARDDLFNYLAWEVDALFQKFREVQSGLAPFLDEGQRAKFVVDYLALVAELQTLDREIEKVYALPIIPNKEAASADLRAERARIQALIDQRQPLAEAIIETQIASVLRDEGFAMLGEVFPPVSAKITQLPMLLVVSPRDVIRRELAINVVNMSVDRMAALETGIDQALNVSSLVVPLGGLALYPSMVIQSAYGPYLFEVAAHEWAHHYLYFFPLGLEYLDTGRATWIINETTASQFGKEIGRRTIERFYGGLITLPPEPTPRPPDAAPTPPPDPLKFDPQAQLNITRVTTDWLLGLGLVDVAEWYMEFQRQVFVANGYTNYRKFNQAFFAFYGGYQSAGGGGMAGADPIGPAIAEIRRLSPSVKAWMETMRYITSREQLLEVRDSLRDQRLSNR